jgi:malonyl CoA-acyl carrier protein transacylase
MRVQMFPGQGSQCRGMGGALFDQLPEYRELEARVDAEVGYCMRELCLEDRAGLLSDTRYTQSALYVVNALHYFKARASGERADYLLGHSLGEYNALFAAGAFDFLTGLRMVRRRGELMAEVNGGGMAAAIGLPDAAVADILRNGGIPTLDVANFNSASQVVVSGPRVDIDRAASVLQRAGVSLYVPLRVSGPFHSRYMTEAARALRRCLDEFPLVPPSLPVISNVTAQPYPAGEDAAARRSILARQVSSPVLWWQSIGYLLRMGATDFLECGPGAVLQGLVKQIGASSRIAVNVR